MNPVLLFLYFFIISLLLYSLLPVLLLLIHRTSILLLLLLYNTITLLYSTLHCGKTSDPKGLSPSVSASSRSTQGDSNSDQELGALTNELASLLSFYEAYRLMIPFNKRKLGNHKIFLVCFFMKEDLTIKALWLKETKWHLLQITLSKFTQNTART